MKDHQGAPLGIVRCPSSRLMCLTEESTRYFPHFRHEHYLPNTVDAISLRQYEQVSPCRLCPVFLPLQITSACGDVSQQRHKEAIFRFGKSAYTRFFASPFVRSFLVVHINIIWTERRQSRKCHQRQRQIRQRVRLTSMGYPLKLVHNGLWILWLRAHHELLANHRYRDITQSARR